MILYGFWRSSATWRVRIGLSLKGLAYEYRPVNLIEKEQYGDAHKSRNPMAQVPVLEDEGGRVRISQSLAILEYLEERFPDPPLLPKDLVTRAHVRQVAEAINAGTQPLGNTSVRLHVSDVLKADGDAWVRHWVTRGLEAVEAMVRPTAGRFAFGDAPTIADACIVPQMFHAQRFGVDVSRFPTLVEIDRTCAAREDFARVHARLQPDAPR